MSEKIQAIRGMNDILPEVMPYWHWLEQKLRGLVASYGYQEIRTPIVETTKLFARSIGEVTDIVEKEMYTFNDRSGDSLTLRPEGTAGCVRAAIQHGLLYSQPQRLWYSGPIFRYERPQKGRSRQFYQFGLEALGFDGPDIDAEQIIFCARLWRELGIANELRLELNSLGNLATRAQYRKQLVEYFSHNEASLDEDSKRRLHSNPLRILDSKNPELQQLISDAPKITEFLDPDSKAKLHGLERILSQAGIGYTINPRLVRGLDYYTGVVFEWITESLGAQGTVCAGGRYDGLVEMLGGKSTPAVGFAMGYERVIELMQNVIEPGSIARPTDIYVIMVGDAAQAYGLPLTESLRDTNPGLSIINHCSGGSFKSQFKRADKSGARLALVIGDDELAQQQITVKYLREKRDQTAVRLSELSHHLADYFS